MSSVIDADLMREIFWKATNDENKWVCVLCIRAGVTEAKATYIIPKGKGNNNFFAHLNSVKHRNVWRDLLAEAVKEKEKNIRLLESTDGLPDVNTSTPPLGMSAYLVAMVTKLCPYMGTWNT